MKGAQGARLDFGMHEHRLEFGIAERTTSTSAQHKFELESVGLRPRIGRPGWCRSIRCAHQTAGGGGSTLLLLELSRPWANDVVMNERALGEKGCSRRFSHGSQGPAHARTGHALGQHSTGRLSGGGSPAPPSRAPNPKG